LGATSFVPKPMNRTILMKAIKDVLHQNKLSVTRKKSTKNNMERTVVLNTNYD
jgi:FixJ family two-component response regulator